MQRLAFNKQGHGWTYLRKGAVRGLISVRQPLSPSKSYLFFSAAFPYVNPGKESGGNIRPYLLFDTAQLEQVIGNNYSYVVDAERFQHDPSQFAATLNAVSLSHVEIEWVYYHQPKYTGPELVSGFGFQFTQGPPQTELDYSNSLALTQEQAYEFSQGCAVSLVSQYERH